MGVVDGHELKEGVALLPLLAVVPPDPLRETVAQPLLLPLREGSGADTVGATLIVSAPLAQAL